MKIPSAHALAAFPSSYRYSFGAASVLSPGLVANPKRSAQRAVVDTSIQADVPVTVTWLTVSQLSAKHTAFSENAVRALIFAAKPRVGAIRKGVTNHIPGNGLAAAIRRVGRRVLINEKVFLDWIDSQGAGGGRTVG